MLSKPKLGQKEETFFTVKEKVTRTDNVVKFHQLACTLTVIKLDKSVIFCDVNTCRGAVEILVCAWLRPCSYFFLFVPFFKKFLFLR